MNNDRGTHQDAVDQNAARAAGIDISAARQALRHLRAAAEAAGASAVRDVHAAGRLVEGNQCLGRIHADQHGAWVLTSGRPEASEPAADELLLLLLQRLAVEWNLEIAELAQALGCKTNVLAVWLSAPRHFRLPPHVAARMNRLVAVERLRIAAGMSSIDVRVWLHDRRAGLGHRSLLERLLAQDQDCFWSVVGAIKSDATSRRAATTGMRLSRRGPWFGAHASRHRRANSHKHPL